jgi:hypothetical protein
MLIASYFHSNFVAITATLQLDYMPKAGKVLSGKFEQKLHPTSPSNGTLSKSTARVASASIQ